MTPADGGLARDRVIIVGAGLAGLFCALRLERPCLIVTARKEGGGASYWAQGGIAAALGPGDCPPAHAADTIAAGAGLCDPAAVDALTTEGPGLVRALAEVGVPFDREADGGFALSLEAAHSQARVARVGGDLAGAAIMQAVRAAALARPGVALLGGVRAHSLITDGAGRVIGLAGADETGRAVSVPGGDVVLATGGAGRLYGVTTNPANALGWAMAMAARAGAAIADPEFVQFHPTALDVGADPAPLATEALRGEGARLIDRDGRSIVDDPRGELAPRDVVARAVHRARAEGRG
ncbi:MAG: FAD-dependent oxidoreductase, partial [Caulobacterales bacterium]|nr:FAD-dependent oxidoreductase [Caulobacterales bacterium]